MSATVVWFRDDLRLGDNPALFAALRRGEEILPVYIHSPEDEGDWPHGAAKCWWRHHSLQALDTSLRKLGSRLLFRCGPPGVVLEDLLRESQANALYWNRRYLPETMKRDQEHKRAFQSRGIEVKSFPGALLQEPWNVANGTGKPYRVFTPFYRALGRLASPGTPIPSPSDLPPVASSLPSGELSDLALLPRHPWAGGLDSAWTPGEEGALQRLEGFLQEAAADYPTGRNIPGTPGSSRLSPHLSHGEISPGKVWAALSDWRAEDPERRDAAAECFLREICWREFAGHLLFHFPETPSSSLNPRFPSLPWRSDSERLTAWQQGRTGYPIVDAGMRELWATGWMHNRVRMIVGSFLIKDLMISWEAGAEWFWDTLVDADLASNTLGWQWVAGCGADASPYHRIFNPTLQAKKFDPEGSYIRRWIPELREVNRKYLFEPWKASRPVTPSYPGPLVDHAEARRLALIAFETSKADSNEPSIEELEIS